MEQATDSLAVVAWIYNESTYVAIGLLLILTGLFVGIGLLRRRR